MNMNTVKENKIRFNNRQVKEAERAREFPHRVALPSEQEHKEIVSNEVLEDYPVTEEAIKNAEKMFGKDMHEIKAKTKSSKLHKVTITNYDMPKEILKKCEDATMAVDIIFENRMSILISRNNKIKFLTVSFTKNRTKRTRINLLKKYPMCMPERVSKLES